MSVQRCQDFASIPATELKRKHQSINGMHCGIESTMRRTRSGFTLIEVMVGVALMGVATVSLYTGFSYCFAVTRVTRENVRATQILQDKMEVMRLLNWDQVANLPGFVPTTFTAPYFASNPTNTSSPEGLTYYGTVLVTNAPISETYASDLRMIQIKLTWTSGNMTRTRQMSTFVSQHGMQKYIY
jgi:prepilin-type N-terminal cleavage/methylation domain-containing protein